MRTIDKLLKAEPRFNCLKPVDTGYDTKCWEWTKTIWSNGYGRIGSERAHRVAFEIVQGEIDAGLSILHKCDNKRCCRPSHLYKGTHGQNMKDYVTRGAVNHSGENSKVSVLTDRDILCIRWLHDSMFFSLGDISKIFNVGRSTINHIITGRTWGRVKGEFKPTKALLSKILTRSGPPVTLTLNFRNDEDLNMVAGLALSETQKQIYESLGVSRGSVRNALGRAPSPMSYSEAKTRRKNYLKWRKQCDFIVSCSSS